MNYRTATINYLYEALKTFEAIQDGLLSDEEGECQIEESVENNPLINELFDEHFDENDAAMIETYLAYNVDLFLNRHITTMPKKEQIDLFVTSTIGQKIPDYNKVLDS